MGIQTEHNTFGTETTLIRKVLGSAYDVVQTVYCHLEYIKMVANNMGKVAGAANNIHRNIIVVLGTSSTKGATVFVPLPAGLTQDKLLDFNVVMEGNDGALYAAEAGHWTSKVLDDELVFTLDADALTTLVNAEIRWVISYEA